MRALLRLELTLLKNNFLCLIRSPLRLALWALYIGGLFVAAYLRIHAPATQTAAASFLSAPLACAFGGAYLAVLSGSIAYHAAGNVKAFRSRAEALLFTNAGLSARTITLWLQVCKLLSLTTRWIWTIALNFVIFSPNHVARGELLRGFIASISGAALLIATEIPAFLLGRMKFGTLFIGGCGATTLIGIAYMLLGLAAADENKASLRLWHALPFDPGVPVIVLLHGPITWLMAFLLLPLLVSLTLIPLGGDAAPELYAASLRSFEVFKRNRSTTLGAVFEHRRRKNDPTRIPAGSLVLLWKEWLAFRRRRWAWLTWLTILSLSMGMAVCMATIATRTHHETDGWALLGLVLAFVFVVPLFASIGLADDVSKPLFWMTTKSLRTRIFVWTCARSWRGALILDASLCIASIGMGDPGATLPALTTATILWFSLNAMGVLLYALFPNRFDGQGPLFFVRLIAAVALLTPCVIVSLLSTLFNQSIVSTAFYASLTLLLEALGSLEFSVRRLRRESGVYLSAEAT